MRIHVPLAFVAALMLAVPAWAAQPGLMKKSGPVFAPLSMKSTSHAFQKNPSGGIQQILAKDRKDKALISDIRNHLLIEAGSFGDGDYGKSKAARYLGKVKPAEIAITYRELPAGAAVDYVGRDAAAVDAIHQWFDAELDQD